MTVVVPSLENSLFLTDTLSIIQYIYKRFQKTPKKTIPYLDDYIISLPALIAEFSNSPNTLVGNIQTALQNCYNRVFNGERTVTVTCNYVSVSTNEYDVNISITYQKLDGELNQVGTTLKLKDGIPVIPEDNVDLFLK